MRLTVALPVPDNGDTLSQLEYDETDHDVFDVKEVEVDPPDADGTVQVEMPSTRVRLLALTV